MSDEINNVVQFAKNGNSSSSQGHIASHVATQAQVQELIVENSQLKQIIGDNTLLLHRLMSELRRIAQASSQEVPAIVPPETPTAV